MKNIFSTNLIRRLTILYAGFVAVICFMPQPQLTGFRTPGIVQFGRLVFLLRPFNTLLGLSEVTSLGQFLWVLCQNLLNIFLLYPLVLGLIYINDSWRQVGVVIKRTFLMSLTIECTQLLLDFLFNANRVFEIDDLMANTFGGLLALWTYQYVVKERFS